jgi:hypothetical protein
MIRSLADMRDGVQARVMAHSSFCSSLQRIPDLVKTLQDKIEGQDI